ncbi:NAC domain-containing protein 101 isoform X2 [Hevea brasiliensis]|uniref:NAC domain-containing protein 101 isoform X2 n=1 Tax=Hevea brasiliensis TaxID=3981 RepID=UPI000B79999B|nr:NAC domain-containing protein 101 isoform X2 [Hevea brasiliensis]
MLDFQSSYTDCQSEILTEFPIGYRFLPTDEELVTHYLSNKVFYRPLPAHVAQDIDSREFYSKAPNSIVNYSCGEREWYFFLHEDEDFLVENNPNRIVGDKIGFWKSTGQEKSICNLDGNVFASKFQFTYFSGIFPNARKTHWKMDEYRLPSQCQTAHSFQEEEWVLVRLKRGMEYSS